MVIQRWQTVLLLVAAVMMCIFCTTPYAVNSVEQSLPSEIFVKDSVVYLIVNIVIAALLFLSIFLFKNLQLQIRVTLISIVLIAASMVTGMFLLFYTMPDAEIIWTGGVLLLVGALIAAIWARERMKKDLKLLRSYDRLR